MHFWGPRGLDDDVGGGKNARTGVKETARLTAEVSGGGEGRSRGKREDPGAELAARMFLSPPLSFFFSPAPSNYVVKREAIKTQEIEQQSHLRGRRFATVY